jgi:competence protein ComEC
MYPLLLLAVSFAFGILVEKFLSLSWGVFFSISLISLFATILIFRKEFAIVLISLAFFSAGALNASIANQTSSENQLKNLYDSSKITSGDPIEVEGVLIKPPELLVGGMFVLMKAESVTYKGKSVEVFGNIRLFTPIADENVNREYRELDLQYGSRILTACEMKREDNFRNPGINSRKEILDQQQIDATCTLKSPLLIEKLSDSEGFSPIATAYRFRQSIIQEFRNSFNQKTSSVLIASLLGNKYFLDKDTADVFREGGTFHVLVISGLHITFIGGLLLLIIRIFTKNRIIQFVFACVVLWAYAIAVGAEVPVSRASLMFTILLFPFMINRKGTLLNSLGASALVLLIWRPEDLFSQSFHLTIVSVTSLISMAFPLIEKLRAIGNWSPKAETPFPPNVPEFLKRSCEMVYWRENVWERDVKRQIWTAKLFKSPYFPNLATRGLQNSIRYISEGLIVSLVVQIWLLPILIVYFNRLSLFSIVLNLWVGTNIAIESFAAIFAVIVSQVSVSLSAPFTRLAELLNWTLLSIPQILIDLDLASRRFPVYSGNFKVIYFVYYIPLIFITFYLNSWNPFAVVQKASADVLKPSIAKILSISFVLCALLIIFHPLSAPLADGRLQLDFLDVGQGDSALITFPNGETMLVDGGGRMNFNRMQTKDDDGRDVEVFEPDTQSIGEAVVSKFLWERGYSEVDYILATHADADHIQGLADVADNFSVKAVFFGRAPMGDEEFAKLYSVLTKRSIPAGFVGLGDNFNIGGVMIEVLAPEHDETPSAISDNNHSVVLRLILGNRKFLMTGDIEKETEKFLVSDSSIKSDVVKVPHHGSRTSSIPEFISATKAIYAIIPVGRTSPFGHPHKEVVERWIKSGAKVMTTGEKGTISISTNGIDLKIETFQK